MTTEKDWRYLTTKELAEILSVTTQSIVRWKNDKGLPYKKFSSRRLEFYIFDVIDWFDKLVDVTDDRKFNRYYPYKIAILRYIKNKEDQIYNECRIKRT